MLLLVRSSPTIRLSRLPVSVGRTAVPRRPLGSQAACAPRYCRRSKSTVAVVGGGRPPVSLLSAPQQLARSLQASRVVLAGLAAGVGGVACAVARPCTIARAEAQHLQDWQAQLPEAAAFQQPPAAAAVAKPQSAAAFFLDVILPDILLLLGAALASVGAAWSNVQISKLLGSLSDSIVKLGATTGGGGSVDQAAVSAAIASLAKPAFALLKAYTVQGALSALYISIMAYIGERLAQRLRKRM